MSVKLFKSLLYKSTQIQQQIEQEHQRPWPDQFRLLKLKKLRLLIKDRLQRIIDTDQIALQDLSLRMKPAPIKENQKFIMPKIRPGHMNMNFQISNERTSQINKH